ncbi:hypothetical protein HYH03_003993 [Edaphochlamys debaryana]|uniref:Uncharacterized protein n=1 Tax=Edaphochlamys debaryana TaxID=47281 RepID=A0A835Y905_9CHLO|nr:hypothetical protein HYH03_003993 [Edaphochlamys debaryana]|eukprot:KAG2498243.1 hypothetical protein HYH03_003993 [Edaphochlamys debaryana]
MALTLRFVLLAVAACAVAASVDVRADANVEGWSRREMREMQRRKLQERKEQIKGCITSFGDDVLVKSAQGSSAVPASRVKIPNYKGPVKLKDLKERVSKDRSVQRKGAQSDTCKTLDLNVRKGKAANGNTDCSLERNKDRDVCKDVWSLDVPCQENDCCFDGGITTEAATTPARRLMGLAVDAETQLRMPDSLRALLQTDDDEEDEEEDAIEADETDEVLTTVAGQVSQEETDDFCNLLADPGFQAAAKGYRSTRTRSDRRRLYEELHVQHRRQLNTPQTLATNGVQNLDITCRGDNLCPPGKTPYDGDKLSWKTVNDNLINQNYSDFRTDTFRSYNQIIGCRVVETIKIALTAACDIGEAVGVVATAGWIVEIGTEINVGKPVCAVIKAAADGANTWCKYAIEDANFHDGIINGYEILGAYENSIVIGNNQLVAYDLTKANINSAKDAVIEAADDNTARLQASQDANLQATLDTVTGARDAVRNNVTGEHSLTRADITAFRAEMNAKLNALDTKLGNFIDQVANSFTALTNLINQQFRDQNAELKRRFDFVDAELCTVRDQGALIQREANYLRKLLTIPEGSRPGFTPNPKKDSVPLMSCSDPAASVCRSAPRTAITGATESWQCFTS